MGRQLHTHESLPYGQARETLNFIRFTVFCILVAATAGRPHFVVYCICSAGLPFITTFRGSLGPPHHAHRGSF